jgi:hypothetical protein
VETLQREVAGIHCHCIIVSRLDLQKNASAIETQAVSWNLQKKAKHKLEESRGGGSNSGKDMDRGLLVLLCGGSVL